VWVATLYDELPKQLLYAYKFGRAKAAAGIIAEQLDAHLPHISSQTVVSYVPTATKRVRQRGYDHAELIARALAVRRGLVCRRLVTRLTQTRQVGASRTQRIAQMKQAFCLAVSLDTLPSSVLVVDDILTTGSTVEAVATVLRESGARRVDAVVFAQKV
jgi:ComF family protein